MAGKLDQSLDDIMKTERTSRRTTRRPVRATRAVTKPTAPSGGVKKSTKNTKPTTQKVNQPVVQAAAAKGESKILVSGLPVDVSEEQIKEYFAKTIGPVKKVLLTYGPNGQSRGISTIVFAQAASAAKAAAQLNGVKVDNRGMKIEVILGPSQAAATAAPKALTERVEPRKPAAKAQPKPAAASGNKTNNGPARRGGRTRARGGAKNTRGKSKTVEELDAEMVDYFEPPASGNATTSNAAQAPVTNSADAGMEDEIM